MLAKKQNIKDNGEWIRALTNSTAIASRQLTSARKFLQERGLS